MSTRAARFWFMILVIATDVAFVAGLENWAPTFFFSKDTLIVRAEDERGFERPSDPTGRYLAALLALSASIDQRAQISKDSARPSWFVLRTAVDQASDEPHEILASVARQAREFENEWTDEDRKFLRLNSARAFASRSGLFSSFPVHCLKTDDENLRKRYSAESLSRDLASVRALVLNEQWNDAYLQRQAIRRLLLSEPRFEKYRELAQTFYDENCLEELKRRFPAPALESVSAAEAHLLKAKIRASEIRSYVAEMVAIAPNCFTIFDSAEREHDLVDSVAQPHR